MTPGRRNRGDTAQRVCKRERTMCRETAAAVGPVCRRPDEAVRCELARGLRFSPKQCGFPSPWVTWPLPTFWNPHLKSNAPSPPNCSCHSLPLSPWHPSASTQAEPLLLFTWFSPRLFLLPYHCLGTRISTVETPVPCASLVVTVAEDPDGFLCPHTFCEKPTSAPSCTRQPSVLNASGHEATSVLTCGPQAGRSSHSGCHNRYTHLKSTCSLQDNGQPTSFSSALSSFAF